MHDYDGIPVSNKEMAIMVLVCFAALFIIFGAGYVLGLSHGKDVHDNGSGTQPITNELGQIGTAIENAGAGINEAQGHAGNVQAGIDNASEQADYIYGTAKTSTELIGQSKSIIEAVRRRGKADKVTH